MEQRKPLSLTGDGFSIDDANCHDVNAVHTKILDTFSFIEKNLNLTIDQIINKTHNSVSIYGLDISFYDNSIWSDYRKDSKAYDKIMEFGCSSFCFTLPQPSSSLLTIKFDCYFNLQSVEFKSMSKHVTGYSKIELIFNSKLDCISIYFNPAPNTTVDDKSWLKRDNTLCSLEDELLFLKMIHVTDDAIKGLLPECYVPSAYDFNSKDFIDRLKLFEMLQF